MNASAYSCRVRQGLFLSPIVEAVDRSHRREGLSTPPFPYLEGAAD
jgi:hypothetical protein